MLNISDKKIVSIVPHLSTGGSPEWIRKVIELIKDKNDVHVIEFTCYSSEYVVQRKKIIEMIGIDKFYTLGSIHDGDDLYIKKRHKLLDIINDIQPDIVHLNEMPESFSHLGFPESIARVLYSKDRKYKIYETSHGSQFNPQSKKKFLPDLFVHCSKLHFEQYKSFNIPMRLLEYPITYKKRPNREGVLTSLGLDPCNIHVLQVGLFTNNKNQKYTFELASETVGSNIQYHFIGNHCFKDKCSIPGAHFNLSNCILWGERSDVDKFMSCMDYLIFPSLNELNPIVLKEACSWNMKILLNSIYQYCGQYDNNPDVSFLSLSPTKDKDFLIKNKLYSKADTLDRDQVSITYMRGIKVSLSNNIYDKNEHNVKFIDRSQDMIVYDTNLKRNMWASPTPQYYVPWEVLINNKHYEKFDLSDKIVYIHLDSKSLGDSLAWIPYVDEFRKKNNCHIVCSTFWNSLFDDSYEEIAFIDPSAEVTNHYAEYWIGWFENSKNKINPKTIPLQQTAADVLGLAFEEIKPKVNLGHARTIKKKYVCIATQSTMQAKYWNVKNGWEAIVDYLNKLGYEVVCIDKHASFGSAALINKIPKNVSYDTGDKSIERCIKYLEHADFFIGIGSGLSWLAWACNVPVILVSSFSKPFCEFKDCMRIYNDNQKSGYFNNPVHNNDFKHDWNWNPIKKCETFQDWYDMETITVSQVKKSIDKMITNQK